MYKVSSLATRFRACLYMQWNIELLRFVICFFEILRSRDYAYVRIYISKLILVLVPSTYYHVSTKEKIRLENHTFYNVKMGLLGVIDLIPDFPSLIWASKDC